MRPQEQALARHHAYTMLGDLLLEGVTLARLPLLQAVPEAERSMLLVSFSTGTDSAPPRGQFDIWLRRVS